MDILILVSLFLIGVFGGFFGATVGGGGLFMIPYLMFTGLAAPVAVASARFGDIGLAIAASYKYWKEKKILWKYVPILAILSLVGSLIGARILLAIDPSVLKTIAALLLFALLPIVLFKKKIGTEHREVSTVSRGVSSCLYFVLQTVTGFFGAGTGPLTQYTLMVGFGFTIVEGAATQMIPFLILTLSSTAVFAWYGLIDLASCIPLFIGSAVGGYLGAHFASKTSTGWLKALFAIMVIAAGFKLLLF